MRSELIYAAKRTMPDRFLLIQTTAKAARAIHRPHSALLAETINETLRLLATKGEMMPVIEGSEVFSHEEYKDGHLHLTFKTGGVHAYPISAEKYADFQKADSKGSWFHKNIRSKKIEGKRVEVSEP